MTGNRKVEFEKMTLNENNTMAFNFKLEAEHVGTAPESASREVGFQMFM